MSVYEKLSPLKISLPEVTPPGAAYVAFVRAGNLLFLSGHIAKKGGKPWVSQLGLNMTTDQGKEAARAVAVDLMGPLNAAVGDLVQRFPDLTLRELRGTHHLHLEFPRLVIGSYKTPWRTRTSAGRESIRDGMRRTETIFFWWIGGVVLLAGAGYDVVRRDMWHMPAGSTDPQPACRQKGCIACREAENGRSV